MSNQTIEREDHRQRGLLNTETSLSDFVCLKIQVDMEINLLSNFKSMVTTRTYLVCYDPMKPSLFSGRNN